MQSILQFTSLTRAKFWVKHTPKHKMLLVIVILGPKRIIPVKILRNFIHKIQTSFFYIHDCGNPDHASLCGTRSPVHRLFYTKRAVSTVVTWEYLGFYRQKSHLQNFKYAVQHRFDVKPGIKITCQRSLPTPLLQFGVALFTMISSYDCMQSL